MKKRILTIAVAVLTATAILFGVYVNYTETGKIDKDKVNEAVDTIVDAINTYEMTNEQVEALPTTEVVEQTEEQENAVEQTVESEGFELQGQIAYEGAKAETWDVELGDYKGLTYYSQLDSRWANKPYTSCGNGSQTIGSSGCAPTCASMIVTATKGAITPDTMCNLFVKYGYRSSNNGTYLSAFRAVADEFNIGYEETYNLDRAVELLRNNHYVAASCANGLFTTGGHLILIVGIDGDTLKIYDPYLYSGKFETSTRRGKVTVSGNTVYCSIDNFRRYANYTRFFAYAHDENVPTNNTKPVVTNTYTRFVKANGGLNVRNCPNGKKVGAIANGTQVTIYSTSGNWSRIGTNRWVCSDYLTNSKSTVSSNSNTKVNTKKYSNGSYKVNASLLNVRTGPGINYKAKKYNQLSQNARKQNKALGNAKANGYKKGVICTVTKVKNNWGLTNSGWICLDYCKKI